jgi:archaetidylinositol phosphate synthase
LQGSLRVLILRRLGSGRADVSHDTLIHRAAAPVVRVAETLGLSPDQLTGLRLLTGLGAAALFAAGPGRPTAVGAGVLLVSLLLDRADGALARRTGRFSARGHRLDLWADAVSTVAVFLGLGWGLRVAMGAWGPALGAAAGASVVAVFALVNIGEGGARPPGYASPCRAVVIDPDDALALLPVLLWLRLGAPVLVMAAVLTPAVATCLWLAGARRSRAEDQAASRP